MRTEQQQQVEALIAQALAAGVTLYEKNGALAYRQNNGFPAALKQQVVAYKSEILAYFQQQQGGVDEATNTIKPRPEGSQPLPLSYGQQGLWFIEQLQGSRQYYMPAQYLFVGELDVAAFRAAVIAVIRRHEILRARFVKNEETGEPQLHILAQAYDPVTWLDASQVNKAQRDAYIAEQIELQQQRPFSLEQGELLRVLLISDGEHHRVAFNMHHIVSDGASMAVLGNEIALGYRHHLGLTCSPLPTLKVQYGDYSLWQRERLQPTVIAAPLQRMKQQLSSLAPLQSLPSDYPRPAKQLLQGKIHRHTLGSDVMAQITAQAKRLELTPFMWLLNTFMLFIARLNQSQRAVIGTPELGRHQPELQSLIGLFVNTLVMQAECGDDVTFATWLQQQKERNIEAFEYRDIPFDKVVEAVGVEHNLSHHPLLQILFTLEQRDEQVFSLPGLTVTELKQCSGDDETVAIKCDLELQAVVEQGALILNWKYDCQLYQLATIQHWAECFETLIKAALAAPERKISQLDLLNAQQQQALLNLAQPVPARWPQHATINSILAQQVERFAQRIAVQDSDHALTYAALQQQVDSLAARLLTLGIRPADMVVVSVARRVEMIVTLLAVLRLGAAYVPVDPEYPQQRVDFILADVQSPMLLCDNSSYQRFAALDCQLVNIDDASAEASAAQRRMLDNIEVQASDLAYMIYTSGTTGKPKGVQIEHRHVVRLLHVEPSLFGFSERDTWSLFHSFCFDFSVWEMYGALLFGGRLVVVDKATTQDSQAFAEWLIQHRVTVLNQTPSAFYALQAACIAEPELLTNSALRYVIFGGEALQPSKLRPWQKLLPKCQLINMYGITETTVHVTFKALSEQDLILGSSNIGCAIPTTQCYVLDQQQQLLPQGAIGELYVGGEGVSRGYWQRDALNRTRFIKHSFVTEQQQRLYRSGDLVRLQANGELSYIGRIDDQVKVRGYRIELGEIESQLRCHPEVADVTVLLQQHDTDNAGICAFLVLKQQAAFDDLTLSMQQFLRQKLPEHMLPTQLLAVAQIPLTSNGKVDKKALLQQLEQQPQQTDFMAPQGELEVRLAGLFAEILPCQQVGRCDDFFRLGGHSLLATQLVNQIRKQLQLTLPLQLLFQYPTVQGLAAQLTQCDSQQLSDIPVRDNAKAAPLSFAQQRLWLLDQIQQGSQQYHIQTLLRLTGPLQLAAFEQSWRQLVTRHQVLRSAIKNDGGTPYQQLIALPDSLVRVLDLSDQTQHWQTLQWQKAVRDDAATAFDLSRGPLLRVTLLKLAATRYQLIVNIHHIACDGQSIEQLITELQHYYAHFAAGVALPVALTAAPKLQYADFASWQRQQQSQAQRDSDGEFWAQHLAAAPPIHQIPLDKPRSQTDNNAAHSFTQILPQTQWCQIQQQCQNWGITPFIWLHTAYAITVAKYSQCQDVVIGSPFSGRHHPDLETLVGFFVNVLPIRVKLDWQQGFTELLQRQRALMAEIHRHQSLPFEQLLEQLQINRERGHHSIFQLSFAFNPTATSIPQLHQVAAELLNNDNELAKFDLELSATAQEQGLRLHWLFNRELFVKSSVESLAHCFTQIVAQLLQQPEQELAQLELLPGKPLSERQIAGRCEPSHTETLLLQRIAQQFALPTQQQRVAVVEPKQGTSLTYQDLQQQVDKLASLLLAQGLQREQVVIVAIPRGVDLIVTMLAILKAGGCYLPIDPDYPEQRIAFILQDSQSAMVFTKQAYAEVFQKRVSGNQKVICLDDKQLQVTLASTAVAPAFPNVAGEQLAYVIYTSGTTGNPKGVMISHLGLTNLCAWHIRAFAVNRDSVASQTANPAFDAAAWEVWPYLCAGASLVCVDKATLQAPEQLRQLLDDHSVSHCFLATPIAEALLNEPSFRPQTLAYLLVGGDKLSPVTSSDLPFKLINNYGPTEATVVATSGQVESEEGLPDIGLPLDNTQLLILDAQGKPVPQGMIGELCVCGTGLARGYLNQPQLSAEKFITIADVKAPIRIYKTGDLVRQLGNGRIAYVGRNDSQVKVRGYRIELTEIEQQISCHPAVSECAVSLMSTAAKQAQLVAFLVPSASAQDTMIEQVKARLAASLPSYMVPQQWLCLTSLPLTTHGKLDHRRLAQLHEQQSGDTEVQQASSTAPNSDVEAQLLAIYRQVLNRASLRSEDDYFTVGGDSILSIQIASKARAAQLQVTAADVFAYPSVASLAGHLRQSLDSPTQSQQQVALTGHLEMLPIQRWFFAQQFAKPHHWNQSVLVAADKSVTLERLKSVISTLIEHHDALRLVAAKQLQLQDTVNITAVVEHIALEQAGEDWPAQLYRYSETRLAGFDLRQDPLFKVILFTTPEPEPRHRILFCAHHLVIDGVSWRILLEDVQQLLLQLSNQVPLSLPAASANLQQIAAFFQTLADQQQHLAHWQAVAQAATGSGLLPLLPHAAAQAPQIRRLTQRLDKQQTQALLVTANHAYNTSAQSLLLSALAWYAKQYGKGSEVIMLEGHGRELLRDEVDASRTLGWLTALYPLHLFSNGSTLQDVICSVKEQLARSANIASSYGALRYLASSPEVRESVAIETNELLFFNYLGQLDTVLEQDGVLCDADEGIGKLVADENQHYFGAQLTAAVVAERLTLSLEFDLQRLSEQQAQALCQAVITSLTAVLEHCVACRQRQFTLSDFALLDDISARQLQQVTAPFDADNILDIYPLSSLQQGMWFHSQMSSDALPIQPYVEQTTLLLSGDVDLEAFLFAWQQLLKQHSILRTAFVDNNGVPLQVELSAAELPLRLVESTASGAEQINQLKQDANLMARQPLQLNQAPCMELHLTAFADGAVGVIWRYHHLIMDGWSLPVLFAELIAFYRARCAGARRLIHTDRYRDYLVYLKRRAGSDAEFWRTYLAEVSAPTLLSEKVHAPRPSDTGIAERDMTLSVGQTRALQLFAAQHSLTLNQVIVGLWGYWLATCCNEDYALFGQTISGRPASLERVSERVGLYINTQAVYLKVDQQQSISEYLSSVKQRLNELADYPHTALTQVQRYSSIDSSTPLFDTLYVFENYPQDPLTQGEGLPFDVQTLAEHDQTHYPLTFVVGVADKLSLTASYQRQCFADSFIESSLAIMAQWLETVTLDSTRTLSTLPLQPNGVASTLPLPSFCLDSAPVEHLPAPATTLHQYVEQAAAAHPEAIAVSCYSTLDGEPRRYQYRQLQADADQLAHYLRQQLGAKPDNPIIALCMSPSYELVVAILAVLKLGGAYLPIAEDIPAARRSYMLNNANATLCLLAAESNQDMHNASTRFINLAAAAPQIEQQLTTPIDSRVTQSDLCYLIYTSGTTGKPKGVMVEHRSVVNYVQALATQYQIRPGDNYLQFSSMSFDVFAEELFCTLTQGATLVVADTQALLEPRVLAQFSQHAQLSLMSLPTAYWQQLALSPVTLADSVRVLTVGGEQMQPEALKAWQQQYGSQIQLLNAYGPTEATISATLQDVSTAQGEQVAIGQPVAGLALHIFDQQLRPVPKGVEGELYISGVGLARGYIADPEKTASTFITLPKTGTRLYKTGDRACLTAADQLLYLGRSDAQVKIRGYRVELGEVERHLMTLEAVKACAVVTRQDGSGVQQLVAFVQPDRVGWDPEQLFPALQGMMPDYMVPRLIKTLGELPLTSNGKVDRKRLQTMAAELSLATKRTVTESLTPLQSQLAAQFAKRLSLPEVGLDDNLFALGGHSLMAMRLLGDIKQQLDVDLSLSQLLANPSVRALAERLQQASEQNDKQTARGQTLICMRKGELGYTPVVLLGGAGGWLMAFHALLQKLDERIPVYGLQPEEIAADTSTLHSVALTAEHYLAAMAAGGLEQHVHLVGHSFGSFIAQQMAATLELQGKSAKSLTLIDTPVPKQPTLDYDRDEIAAMMLDNLVAFFALKLSEADVQHYLRGDADAQLQFLMQHLAAAGFHFNAQHLRYFKQVYSAQLQANIKISAMLKRTPVNVVKAEQTQDFEGQPIEADMGWRPFSQLLSSYEVEGDHLSCLQIERVGQLVAIIERNYVLL